MTTWLLPKSPSTDDQSLSNLDSNESESNNQNSTDSITSGDKSNQNVNVNLNDESKQSFALRMVFV